MIPSFPVRPVANLSVLSVISIPGSPDWVAVDEKGVWISNKDQRSISLISPAQNAVVGEVVLGGHPCSGLACGFGSVWVPMCDPGALVRLDPFDVRIKAEIQLCVSDSEGGLTIDGFGVWILGESADVLLRIDPSTNKIARRISVDEGSHVVVSGGGRLWVSSSTHNRVTCINPSTGGIEAVITVGPQPRFMCTSQDALWVLNQGDGSVSRIGFSDKRISATVYVGVPGRGGDIAFGFNSVWVTAIDKPLTRIDAKTDRIVVQYVGRGGDAIRTGFGSLWMSSFVLEEVWRVDPNMCI